MPSTNRKQNIRYESQPTFRRNVGVSYVSQALADAQASAMDSTDCTECKGCTRLIAQNNFDGAVN